jgi:predicted RNA binding protein YcfA (HicA-like mRNA interferase family)
VTVAMHAGQIIPPKSLRKVIRNAGLTVQQFIDLL